MSTNANPRKGRVGRKVVSWSSDLGDYVQAEIRNAEGTKIDTI